MDLQAGALSTLSRCPARDLQVMRFEAPGSAGVSTCVSPASRRPLAGFTSDANAANTSTRPTAPRPTRPRTRRRPRCTRPPSSRPRTGQVPAAPRDPAPWPQGRIARACHRDRRSRALATRRGRWKKGHPTILGSPRDLVQGGSCCKYEKSKIEDRRSKITKCRTAHLVSEQSRVHKRRQGSTPNLQGCLDPAARTRPRSPTRCSGSPHYPRATSSFSPAIW